MVDVTAKVVTTREAVASARLHASEHVLDRLLSGSLPKGDAFATARVAGILAAKRTSEWIPLCHPLSLDWVQIDFERVGTGELSIRCTVRTTSRTGAEMESLVGATCAALTLYDMAKAVDKTIVVGPIQLERKTGGKSGTFDRAAGGGAHPIAPG